MVVRFDCEEDEIELEIRGSEVAQVQSAYGNPQCLVGHLDTEPGAPDRFDLGRPLIDDRDGVAGLREISAQAAADRTGSEHRDIALHV
jgi:hypothetical protein